MIRRPRRSPLFPYTPLFRSESVASHPVIGPGFRFLRASGRRVDGWPVGDARRRVAADGGARSEEHTSELQSRQYLVCRLLLEKKKTHVSTSVMSLSRSSSSA